MTQKFLLAIYLRGGQVIRMWFTEFSTKTENTAVVNMKWKCADPHEQLMQIHLPDILAIVQESYIDLPDPKREGVSEAEAAAGLGALFGP
jgi:hypothetical protein